MKWSSALLLGLILLTVLQTALLRWLDPPFSACMLWDWLDRGRDFSLMVDYAPAEKISPHLARAVLAAEDQRFYDHRGFDWVEMRRAVEAGRQGGRLRGASTISMQTAKNMFLWRDRSYVRKGLEAYYTVLLELFLPKNRILEIYLNVAEFGPGLYGAPAASKKYFKRPPLQLNQDQAARLARVLPAPALRSPVKLTPAAARRVARLRREMRAVDLDGWPGR